MPRTLVTLPSPDRLTPADRDIARALSDGFEAVRVELAVPVVFSADVLAEAALAAGQPVVDAHDRHDHRGLPFVTIDPPGSRDLDQAMHLERRAGGGYRVFYAIADVASFVLPGGALDLATALRVATVYCPDRRVPLHPPLLSEGAASLLPGQDRRAVVWTLDLDGSGELVGTDVRRALVRSRAQLEYAEVQRSLETDDPGGESLPVLLAEIGRLRQGIERARGGVSLSRPEQEVVPDAVSGGWTTSFRASLPVEDYNAQISLLTGTAAARLMIDARIGVLRTMPAAPDEAIARLRRQALALGVPWPKDKTYGDVLAEVDHADPHAAAFLAAATSLFRGAVWTPFDGSVPADTVHGAIGAPYAHVTAPLRRLVDRFGLEIALAVNAGAAVPSWVVAALPRLGEVMAGGARRAAAVDRACLDLVEATILAGRQGQDFDGVAIEDDVVQLAAPAIVARCTGVLPVGERVRVRLVRADPDTRELVFEVRGPHGDAGAGHRPE